MEKHDRISRGRQIVRLWAFLNYEDDEGGDRATIVDILTDLYHFCQTKGVVWTDAVSSAERWGLQESIVHDRALNEMDDDQAQRLLDAIFNADPLSANDPEEMYCDACGAKRNATDLVPVNNDWTCPECSHAWDEEEDND